VIGFWPSW